MIEVRKVLVAQCVVVVVVEQVYQTPELNSAHPPGNILSGLIAPGQTLLCQAE